MAATVADLQTKGIARLFNREQDRPATTSMQYFEAPIVIDNAAHQVLDKLHDQAA